MRTRLSLASLAFAALLSACASSTAYGPAAETGYGFNETRIEQNRYQVSFSGNSLTDLQTVERYLLYRAAELTVQNDYDYFIMVNRQTDEDSSYRSTGFAQPNFALQYYSPSWGWRHSYSPFYNDVDMREVSRFEALAEVLMGSGTKPADVNAYGAEDVLANMAPSVQRAGQPL